MPKGKKHSPEQIVRLLRDAEASLGAGRSVAQICQEIGISDETYARSARTHIELAEAGGASIPSPVSFAYVCGGCP